MKAYEALAKAFVNEGTREVFGLMGDANMHWMNALARQGVQLFEARHEGAALGMAHGWAKATGEPGIVTTTSGPGASQLATSMIVANRARTPIVAFCGETNLGDFEAVQYLDQARFAAAIECGFVHMPKADQAYASVQRAFYLARSESRPVMLSVPMDVQTQQVGTDEDYVTSSELLGTMEIEPIHGRIVQAADIIASSDKVVLLVGRGAKFAQAQDQILRLQKKLGAIIATTIQAKNWLRSETEFHVGISGLFGTKVAHEILQDADCVIAVGASLNRYTVEHGYLYPKTRYIQIDRRDHVVTGTGAPVDCFVQSDAKGALELLIDELDKRTISKAGYHGEELKRQLELAKVPPEPFVSEKGLVDPREACLAIDEEMPGAIDLVLGSGHQVDFGMMFFNRPRSVAVNYGMFGAIGQGLLLAIGASIGNGLKPTFLVEGDASFLMHLSEFETACRYKVPLLVIVFNDEALGAEFQKSVAHGDLDPALAVIPTPNLGVVAKSLGGEGALVRSIDELRKALKTYLINPGPTVLDVRISRDVVSIPYRRLWYGDDV